MNTKEDGTHVLPGGCRGNRHGMSLRNANTIADGNAAALADLYDEAGADAYRIALIVLGDAAAAASVVEDLFLRVWHTRGSGLDGDTSASLLALTREAAVGFHEAHPGLVRSQSDCELCTFGDGDGGFDKQQLARAVETMPPRPLRILLLVGVARLSPRQAMSVAGCDEAELRRALRLGLEHFRIALAG